MINILNHFNLKNSNIPYSNIYINWRRFWGKKKEYLNLWVGKNPKISDFNIFYTGKNKKVLYFFLGIYIYK